MVPCTAKGSCRCKGIHGRLPIAWDTLQEKGLQNRPTQQTIPLDVRNHVWRKFHREISHMLGLSIPSRCLLTITTGKRRPGAADCSESIKLLLCSPAECEHRILTVTAVCCSHCCWGTIRSFPCRYFFGFPNGKSSDTEAFEAERAVLGGTGKNPGMIFFFKYMLQNWNYILNRFQATKNVQLLGV